MGRSDFHHFRGSHRRRLLRRTPFSLSFKSGEAISASRSPPVTILSGSMFANSGSTSSSLSATNIFREAFGFVAFAAFAGFLPGICLARGWALAALCFLRPLLGALRTGMSSSVSASPSSKSPASSSSSRGTVGESAAGRKSFSPSSVSGCSKSATSSCIAPALSAAGGSSSAKRSLRVLRFSTSGVTGSRASPMSAASVAESYSSSKVGVAREDFRLAVVAGVSRPRRGDGSATWPSSFACQKASRSSKPWESLLMSPRTVTPVRRPARPKRQSSSSFT
mmetsp:Transcript_16165/g.61637  ORF Transcript_16165/g.61637 Transcript_16165/m.61637 type:complete len:280 (+) Transcript_16165:862-1701(+)